MSPFLVILDSISCENNCRICSLRDQATEELNEEYNDELCQEKVIDYDCWMNNIRYLYVPINWNYLNRAERLASVPKGSLQLLTQGHSERLRIRNF